MIPQDTVAKILDAAQIVDVVGDFVTLRRRGASYVACCPFHNEKTPSFHVSPSKGIYKCFGCGKSGTAVGFVMEHESLSYGEALKYLARKYHIEVVEKEETAEEIAARQRNESLLLVSEFAHQFFQASLDTEEGRAVGRAYFRSRGLEDATVTKYGLGWAPSDRQTFVSQARAKGYKEEYLVDTGLAVRYDDGRMADRFYDRVVFPIHSVSGRVIAFGARTLKTDKNVPKYVNSPETEIYVKSKSLYGIWFAKNEMSRQDRCYLVEGYLDVLSLHQLGITNAVASSGTALTVEQIRLIKKFTENVTIMYDGDSAGIHAALRGIGLVLKEGMNVKVVLLPDGDDPDSFSRKHTLEEVRAFIAEHEQDFIAFKTDLLLGEAGSDPQRRADLINDIADTIAQMPDPVKRTVYAQSSAEKFDIDAQILFDRIRRTREKMLLDDRNAAERERRRREADASRSSDAPQAPEDVSAGAYEAPQPALTEVVPTAQELAFESRALAPTERELLWFLYTSGVSPMEFESDSEYYDPEERCSVADFIRGSLEADGFEFVNSVYRKAYDAYFALYDGRPDLLQEDIVKILMDGEDRSLADLTAELTQEKYHLSVSNYKAAMTATATMLVMRVPRSIRVYQEKRLAVQIRELEAELKTADMARQLELMGRMKELMTLRTRVLTALGRVQ